MKIFLGSDHAGYELKEKLVEYLAGLGLENEIVDKGPFNYNANDDYPDFIKLVAEEVSQDEKSFGIILGGSGQGEAICANRTPNVRAVVFYGPKEPVGAIDVKGEKSIDSFEIIKLGRMHNNANILSIGSRFVTDDEAKFATELFINTKFTDEERHIRRIKKIDHN